MPFPFHFSSSHQLVKSFQMAYEIVKHTFENCDLEVNRLPARIADKQAFIRWNEEVITAIAGDIACMERTHINNQLQPNEARLYYKDIIKKAKKDMRQYFDANYRLSVAVHHLEVQRKASETDIRCFMEALKDSKNVPRIFHIRILVYHVLNYL